MRPSLEEVKRAFLKDEKTHYDFASKRVVFDEVSRDEAIKKLNQKLDKFWLSCYPDEWSYAKKRAVLDMQTKGGINGS